MEEKGKDLLKKDNKILRKVLIVIGALIILYVILSIVFMNRFFIGTRINGIDASFASVETMEKRISKAAKNYEMVIESNGSAVDSINGSEIDLDVNLNNPEIQNFLSTQDGFLWPKKLFYPDDFIGEKIVTYDKTKLYHLVLEKPFANRNRVKKSKDAIFKFNGEKYEIVPEEYGNEVSARDFCGKIRNKLYKLQRKVDLEKDALYIQPKVKKDSPAIVGYVKQLNEFLDTKIEFEEGFTLAKEDLASFIDTKNKHKYSINKEAVEKYVDRIADEYTTVGKPRFFKTSYGSSVEIPGGTYGWKVDKEEELKVLLNNLEKKKDIKRELQYSQTAASHEKNDFGDSYVEVNLSTQHLFFYVDGKCIMDTDLVSGNLARGNGTHVGVFPVSYTARNAVLRGDDYETPVNFWMPFNGGEGLHDALWRGSFGGKIFMYSGSHGCVNLPFNAAKTLFSHVSAGFPVLVYSTGEPDNTYVTMANRVIYRINSIGRVTPNRKHYIEWVRAEYNKLTNSQKNLVDNVEVLNEAERQLQLM